MRNEKPKKALFIVHRELIAKQETLDGYNSAEFDWLCIGEVHRAGSE